MINAKEKERLRAAKWRAANPEKAREIARRANAKRKDDPDYIAKRKAQGAEYRRKNNQALKDYDRERKFGVTRLQYAEMFHRQNGVCAICFQAETATRKGNVKALAVDHDHKTGRVRGLLCSDCNTGIGKLKDNPEVLRNAADYLEQF